jgi:opacity protein-like surface antigen
MKFTLANSQRRVLCAMSNARMQRIAITSLFVLALAPAGLVGQESRPSNPNELPLTATPAVQQARGFLFRAPLVNVALRGGFNFARAGSDLFDLATEQLTLEKSDFGAFIVGADIGVHVTDRFDIVGGFAHMSTSKTSEYRDWEDENELPITQRTRFSQTPLTLGARFYLVPRGRQIGQFVWIPATVSPYVGASVGVARWEWKQDGSWVDFENFGIFDDTFESNGWTPIGQGIAGFDYSLATRVILNTEARYTFGSGELGRDFDPSFDSLDLSGLQLSMGLKFRF